MKIKIIGIETQDYKLDNGYAFKGDKLHVEVLDEVKDGLYGNKVTNIKIAATSPLATVPLSVGGEYICFFGQKGDLQFLQESK